jgi:hypothetical protein
LQIYLYRCSDFLAPSSSKNKNLKKLTYQIAFK